MLHGLKTPNTQKLMTRPKVIVINLSTSGSHLGGAAIAAEWHSRFMAKQFHVELWRMWDKDEEFYLDGLKVRNFITKDKFGILGKYLPKQIMAIFFYSDILKYLKIEKPDIIHFQNILTALHFKQIVRYASLSGIKIVVSTHGFYEIFNPSFEFKYFTKLVWDFFIKRPVLTSMKYVDAVLSGYPKERELLLKLGISDKKINLVPNGINPFFLEEAGEKELKDVIEKFQVDTNLPILLFIGNHTKNKGIDTVLKIASMFSKPANFVIGGKLRKNEKPEEWLSSFIPAKGVRVIFTDFLSLNEQRALYRISTMLLFPSLSDTLPLTILEAMACGLPVIAYGVGGIPFELDNGAGIVINPGNFDDYFKSIESLINDLEILNKIAIKAKERRRSLFSWEKAASDTINIYKNLKIISL